VSTKTYQTMILIESNLPIRKEDELDDSLVDKVYQLVSLSGPCPTCLILYGLETSSNEEQTRSDSP